MIAARVSLSPTPDLSTAVGCDGLGLVAEGAGASDFELVRGGSLPSGERAIWIGMAGPLPSEYAPKCPHVRTLWHHSSSVPWQNDYIFASERLAHRLIDCLTLDTPRGMGVQRHCSIVAEFAV